MRHNQHNAQAVASFWGKNLNDQNDWYSIRSESDNTEIRIYDVIGWPFIEADMFVNDLNKINSKNITVRINSPGGDVMDGTAIYNALVDHPANITTKIEGIAASMASIISLAGDSRTIAKNAYYMIHDPFAIAIGSGDDMIKTGELLNRIKGTLADVYAEKTGNKKADIMKSMSDETWYIGQEAVDAGFADSVTPTGSATARFDLSIFNNSPGQHEPTKRDLERTLMQDAGMSRTQARRLLNSGYDSLSTQDAGDLSETNKFIKSIGA